MSKIKVLSQNLNAASEEVNKLSARLKNLKKGTKDYALTVEQLNKAEKERIRAEKELKDNSNGLIKGNKNHEKSIKAMSDATKKSSKAQREYARATKSAKKSQDGFFSGFGKRLTTLGKYLIATKLISAAVGGLSAIFIGGARKAIELDKAFADLSAVAGLTVEELDKVKQTANEVAGVTSLTAVEVVALQKELAKLGVPVDDIQNLTKPIALLSQALGESGQQTAVTLQKIQNAYALTSEEAGDTANTLLGAVNESALNLQDLGVGLQYAGASAKASGVSLEQTTSLLGVLANNGIKASTAGTGLRKIFIELAKEGITFNEFLEDMAENNISLAEAQDRFGTRAANQAVIIAQNVDEYRALNAELGENTRLFEANAKQMGSTQGQIDILISAFDKFLVQFMDFVTQTDLFIDLIGRLSPEAKGQALIYRELAAENENVTNAVNNLIDANVAFGEQTEGTYNTVDDMITLLVEFGEISEDQGKVLARNFKRSGLEANQFAEFVAKNNKQLLAVIEGAQALAEDEAKIITDRNVAEAAANETYQERAAILEELRQKAIKGNLTDEEKLMLENEIAKQLNYNQKVREDARGLTIEENTVLEKRIKLYERLQEELKNVVNAETSDEGRGNKERFDLKRFEVENDRRIQLLKDRRAFELEAAATQEERNDIEIEYARLIADAYSDMSDEIQAAWDAVDQSLYSNGVSVENLISKYEELGILNGETLVKVFQGFSKGFEADTKEAIKEAGDLLKNGIIKDVDEYNAKIEEAIQKNKDVFKQSLASLVATGELTQQQAEQLGQAIDNISTDPKKLFDAESTFLGRLFGLNEKEYIAETSEQAAAEYAEDINKRLLELSELGIKEIADVYDAFADEKIENLRNQADAELDVIKERYRIEEEILKSSLQNQLITESQFRVKQTELKRAQIAEENAVNQKLFQQEQQQDRFNAVVQGAEQIALVLAREIAAKGFPAGLVSGAAGASIIGASTAARVTAINQRKFFPKKFEDGGMVYGPSHAEGGVPFTVQGQGGYEMEGGEFIINKRSASMHRELLERINASGRTSATQGKQIFANGGVVTAKKEDASLEYLRAIAESNVDIAAESKKPTRAFVSSKDLQNDRRERSIRNNNDRV